MSTPIQLNAGAKLNADYNPTPPSNAEGGVRWNYELSVDDHAIRAQLPSFDGFEKPYLLVPYAVKKGVVERVRVDMFYDASKSQPGTHDVYGPPRLAYFSTQAGFEDPSLVRRYGIQILLETNAGTLQFPSAFAPAPIDRR